MRVVLSTIGRFHTFDLARQLHKRDKLKSVFSGYPSFKLRNEGLPKDKVRTFPWLHAPFMCLNPIRIGSSGSGHGRTEFGSTVLWRQIIGLRYLSCNIRVWHELVGPS